MLPIITPDALGITNEPENYGLITIQCINYQLTTVAVGPALIFESIQFGNKISDHAQTTVPEFWIARIEAEGGEQL